MALLSKGQRCHRELQVSQILWVWDSPASVRMMGCWECGRGWCSALLTPVLSSGECPGPWSGAGQAWSCWSGFGHVVCCRKVLCPAPGRQLAALLGIFHGASNFQSPVPLCAAAETLMASFSGREGSAGWEHLVASGLCPRPFPTLPTSSFQRTS